jgi:excisionase family DNA binding protein
MTKTQTEPPDQMLVLTVKKAAELLGIGVNSAYEAVARGELPHIRIGRSIRIPRAALERFLAGKEIEAPDDKGQISLLRT